MLAWKDGGGGGRLFETQDPAGWKEGRWISSNSELNTWWELRGGKGEEEGAGREIKVLSLPKQLPDCMS